MAPPRETQVHMCHLAVGSAGDALRSTLGSCVGVGLLWRERSLCGLAHCLLPGDGRDGPAASVQIDDGPISAKYVTRAIPRLLNAMGAAQAHRSAIEAVVVGGANMVTYKKPPLHPSIGEQNSRVALALLKSLGVQIVHTDIGGECGRQLVIDCTLFEYTVRMYSRKSM